MLSDIRDLVILAYGKFFVLYLSFSPHENATSPSSESSPKEGPSRSASLRFNKSKPRVTFGETQRYLIFLLCHGFLPPEFCIAYSDWFLVLCNFIFVRLCMLLLKNSIIIVHQFRVFII